MVQVPATTADADASFVTSALRSTGVIGSATTRRRGRARHHRRRGGDRRAAGEAPAALRRPRHGRAGHGDHEDPVAVPGEPRRRRPLQLLRAGGALLPAAGRQGAGAHPGLLLERDRRGERRLRPAARGPRRPHDDQPDRRHPRCSCGRARSEPWPASTARGGAHRPSTSWTGCRASTSPSTSPPGSSTGTRGRSSRSASRTPSPTAGSRSASGCSRPSRTCSSPAWPRRRPRSATVTSAATTSCSTTAPIPPTPTTRWRSSTGRSRTAVRRSPTSPTSSASR